MVIAGIVGTGFIVVGTLSAFWSLWWIIQAARSNPGEREAEDAARERVAKGGSWSEHGPALQPFSDAEMAELSAALAPADPEQAGIDVRQRDEPEPRRRFGRR